MARVRSGYSGRDQRGRPTGPQTRDIGPAAAAVDGMAAMGRLSATRGNTILQVDESVALGAGEISRRQATPAERAAWTERDRGAPVLRRAAAGPAIHLLRPAAASMTESRRRGAVRSAEVYASRRAVTPEPTPLPVTPAPSRQEEPVPATVAPTAAPDNHGLRLRYLEALIGLLATGEAAPELMDRIERQLELLGDPVVPEPGPAVVPTPVHTVHTVRTAAVDELAPVARHSSKAGERAEIEARATRALDALERHGGDRKAAAAELGMRGNAFAMVLKHAEAREPRAAAS